ncbi:hypothetical protein HJC23_012117 [Cyclotella cryptica]|uniref:Guanylate cyclase domain-containing protein n=1 Tax=Cyclotella cryptica TaxID=29204 RepID=A0ABD3NQX1_9STRA|eukprot:CCRYP_020163-RA/>CCRYP_020163-RA protein AED:0.22 eAED:0.22 QI:0/-1/0/1/-1/1/1/0/454
MEVSIPDLLITVAYFSIPIQILIALCKFPRLTRRATTRVVVLLVLFALFIFCCGAGHLIRCLDWTDTTLYRVVNILTAVISLMTSIYLMPFVPNLLEGVDKLHLEVSTSKKIIEAMYPPTIRERLLNRCINNDDTMSKGSRDEDVAGELQIETGDNVATHRRISSNIFKRLSRSDSKAARKVHDLMQRKVSINIDESVESRDLDASEPAIADLFPSTSIMFADVSNFTYWSSKHAPSEVFTLLESLFFEFDRIATEMEVFKLSTVGDCYIAAAGVPYPRDDHAVVLSEFAERCRRKANDVLIYLSLKAGMEDVSQLSIRIGIHSGPVTAGVLRGEKARFDLFGDTINTAARIESTGKPNMVHLSSETAELLEIAGKQQWFIPREESVSAKGKGELKTFWLNILNVDENDTSPDNFKNNLVPMKSDELIEKRKLGDDKVSITEDHSKDGRLSLVI